MFIRKKSLTVSFSMLCHIYWGSKWRGLTWSSLSSGEKMNQWLLWYKSFFFPRQKLPTKQLSVHLFLLMLLCVTLFHSLCVVSSRTPCVENECPTWSQSRSCSWFHCVCWADDHRTAEPHLPPLAHTHTKRKFPLFAHRSECFNEHHLQRQLQEKGVRLK